MKKYFITLTTFSIAIILSNLSHAQEVDRDLNKNIFVIVKVSINPGQITSFMDLARVMADDVKANEPGTINYEWTLNQDSTICEIIERYVDSQAFLNHMNFYNGKYAQKMSALGEITDFVLFGKPNEELAKAMGESGSNYHVLFAGFAR